MEHEEERKYLAAVAAALRSARGDAAISQAEVERRTGITRSSYRLYEEGVRAPNAAYLVSIARAFGISFTKLAAEIDRKVSEIE